MRVQINLLCNRTIKINLQIKNTDNELHKVVMRQLLDNDSSIAKMRVISDSELNRWMNESEESLREQKAIPATPLWGLYETILTKKV